MSDLEKRIKRLEDIEEIKSLMGKYYRCLDLKDWDNLKTCFSPNVVTSYSDGKLCFKGPDETVGFFAKVMGFDDQISQHQGHTPEITIDDENNAHGHWYLQDYLVIRKHNLGLRGTAIYTIKYEKVDGAWKILDIGYNRIFEERWNRSDYNNRQFTELHPGFKTGDLADVGAK
ncbi:MAG: nuclear transport factor 2 family protein [Oscillospiraceae bacterium]|nr:nuclear transport factor 2 family protein [Oscillospiraceae bacterium]